MAILETPLLKQFLLNAGVRPDVNFDIRRIGTDDAMVQAIIERIATGEKSMTYSLPWIAEQQGKTPPVAGQYLVVLDAKDHPSLLLQLTGVRELRFGEVTEPDLRREGIPMRKLDAWRPLHITVWNEKLAPFDLKVTDNMPVWAEEFDLIYDAG